ncbi:50S ribosome-binding GTPase, partial [bacterium]|nr:50S ribosome-binding GTPase [bacterium]
MPAAKKTAREIRIALVGNPNTGKTTLFNALTGLNQKVGNYPGVTVERKCGRFALDENKIELIDLPGSYSLAARSPDEMVVNDVLIGQQKGEAPIDLVLAIVDASNLTRNLYFLSQIFELG